MPYLTVDRGQHPFEIRQAIVADQMPDRVTIPITGNDDDDKEVHVVDFCVAHAVACQRHGDFVAVFALIYSVVVESYCGVFPGRPGLSDRVTDIGRVARV